MNEFQDSNGQPTKLAEDLQYLARQVIASAEYIAQEPWSVEQDERLYHSFVSLRPFAEAGCVPVVVAINEAASLPFLCQKMWQDLMALVPQDGTFYYSTTGHLSPEREARAKEVARQVAAELGGTDER